MSDVYAEPVTFEVLAKAIQSWDQRDLPPYPTGAPEVTIVRISIAPGERLPLHKHPVINAGVCVRGTLTVVTQDGETMTVEAGEGFVEVVETYHFGKNDGPEPVELVVFYAGAQGCPITTEKRDREE